MKKHSIVVVGSVNLDFVATVAKLPVAGETVTGAELNRFPGGKGANQALAARRLGAEVSLVACVGNDAYADEALALLKSGGVDLTACYRDSTNPTGIALIAVDTKGENQIVVAAGANQCLLAEMLALPQADALICQLESPIETLIQAGKLFKGFFCANLAPAMEVPVQLIQRADLLIVNEVEATFYGDSLKEYKGLLAITYGAKGAVLKKDNKIIAQAKPPAINAVDTTGAGDTFAAALTLAIIEGQQLQNALEFACAAGAATATKAGAQPSLPFLEEIN